MIDREYIKLNTSLQTASNRNDLVPDENGNYPAIIELNLPNNIFKAKDGAKKVDKVSMLTTKMRMSMSETPIAQIPIDDMLDFPGVLASKCQFDVYPFAFLDNNRLQPESIEETVFPNYKKHIITYRINVYLENLISFVELESIGVIANDKETFPTTSRFFQILKENNAFVNNTDHLMNLCVSSMRGVIKENNSSSVFLTNIGSIEQMLEDGLENAITYASTQTETIVTISLVNTSLNFSSLSENLPNLDSTLYLEDYGVTVCFWKSEQESGINDTSLITACKPKFSFDAQTMTLSYDSAPFLESVPIVWNQSYVDTYERPEQLSIDTLREDIWVSPPPPKRMYQYNVNTSSNPPSYNFAINSQTNCGVMNLIGNKMMKETFSFLPWIKVDLSKISQLSGLSKYQYGVEYTREHTRKKVGEGDSIISWKVNSTLTSPPTCEYFNIDDVNYSEDVVWFCHQFARNGTEVTLSTCYFCYPQDRNSFDPSNIRLINFNVMGPIDAETQVIYSDYTSYVEPIIISSDTSVYEQYSTNVNIQGTLGREVISSQDINDSNTNERRRIDLGKCYLFEGGSSHSDNVFAICWLARDNGKPVGFRNRYNTTVTTYNSGFSLDGAVPDVTYDFVKYTSAQVFEIWVLDASLRSVGGSSPQRTIVGFSRLRESGDTSYLQENEITDYVESTVLSKTTTALSLIPKYEFIPNLDLENETTCYMLDCISSKVKVGEQEVIKLPQTNNEDDENNVEDNIAEENNDEENLYRVTQTTTTWIETDSSVLQWEDNPYAPGEPAAGEFYFYTQGFTPSVPFYLQIDNTLNYENITVFQYIFWQKTSAPADSKIHYMVLIAHDDQTNGVESGVRPVNSYNLVEQNLRVVNTTHTTGEATTTTNTFDTSENITPGTQTSILGQETTAGSISTVVSPTQQYHFNLRDYTQNSNTPKVTLSGLYLDPSKFDLVTDYSNFPFYNDPTMNPYFSDLRYYQVMPPLIDLFQGLDIDATGLKEMCEYIPAIVNLDNELLPDPFSPNNSYVNKVTYVQHVDAAVTNNGTYEFAVYYVSMYTDPPPANMLDPTVIWPNSFNYSCGGGTFTKTQDVVTTKQTVTTRVAPINPPHSLSDYVGNVRLNFTWDNLPTVILSPITSFVLTMAGTRVSDEIQPVNIVDNSLASAQLSTIPIIENYYSTASTLRDLHDELVVIRDQVTNAATYTLANTGGEERTLKFAVKYITKDGKLHQVYVPPNGVFTLQLTFILDLVSI